MGTHSPTLHKKKKSVSDALLEAEQEHYLDCPNADIPLRSAALLLDGILFSIALSGIGRLLDTAQSALPFVIGSFVETRTPLAVLIAMYVAWLLKTLTLVLYFVWSVSRFGGSAAKLIMGLRVVDVHSGACLTYHQALLRELVFKPISAISLVGAALAFLRDDRRTLHDLLSRSTVKRVRGRP